ncbi:hypothetical protein [Demequina rhizosphaerae]|uniref:hypothetical protein n=1 Tax=Demequina rhizosphaerae TaxID=1638985 RepID=UPI0012E09B97|nr:hypothetical protein [Demequina rhizosphaerae]
MHPRAARRAAVAVAVLALAGCAVADQGAATPHLPDGVTASESAVIEGPLVSEESWGHQCFSVATEDGPAALIAGHLASSWPNGNHLMGPAPDGPIAIARDEHVELAGEWVSGEDYDEMRGRCPDKDEYFAIARVVSIDGEPVEDG